MIVAATAGCASSPTTLADGQPQALATEDATPSESASWEEAPVQLLGPVVDGDTLRVVAAYGGGCGAHQFALEPSGPMLKSLPRSNPCAWCIVPQATLAVHGFTTLYVWTSHRSEAPHEA